MLAAILSGAGGRSSNTSKLRKHKSKSPRVASCRMRTPRARASGADAPLASVCRASRSSSAESGPAGMSIVIAHDAFHTGAKPFARTVSVRCDGRRTDEESDVERVLIGDVASADVPSRSSVLSGTRLIDVCICTLLFHPASDG